MLKSKRDESIKRYLRSVGTLKHRSKKFNSLYYSICYSEELNIVIRFADHFKERTEADIEIIKVCEFYTIRTVSTGITYTVTENNIITYLKSILLIYPELNNVCNSYKNAFVTVNKELDRKKSDIDRVDTVLNKEREYKDTINSLSVEVKNLTNQVNMYKDKINKLNNKISHIKSIVNNK